MIKCQDTVCAFNTSGGTMCCIECDLRENCANFCRIAEEDEWQNCEYAVDTDTIQYEQIRAALSAIRGCLTI